MKSEFLLRWGFGVLLLGIMLAGEIAAPGQVPTSPAAIGSTNQQYYPVTQFELGYTPVERSPHPDLPPLSDLMQAIRLERVGDELLPSRSAGAMSTLADLNRNGRTNRLRIDALSHLILQLSAEFKRRGIAAAWAAPSRNDIDPTTGEDLRTDRGALRIMIHVGEIQQIRTLAKGARIPPAESANNPKHAQILAHSPLLAEHDPKRGDLLRKAVLDGYIERLNRFPGRSVDASIASSGSSNGLVLDYLVHEDKQWIAYAQFANTGTESAGLWRERFGAILQQVTRRDDILTLDYVTSGFDSSHAGFGSYERPLIFPNYLKAKVYGSYGTYQADELGLSAQSLQGSQAIIGGELVYNPLSLPKFDIRELSLAPLFLDLTLGARWQGIEVDNETFGASSETDLFLPYAGVSLTSVSQEAKFSLGLQVEGNLSDLAGTEKDELTYLGRANADTDWIAAKWGAGLAFFLEPLLAPRSSSNSLVHELSFSGRGQCVFDDRRVIPQVQETIGGFYSVRGYPEALDAGDDVVVSTAEYRIYFARAYDTAPDQVNVAVGSKTSAGTQYGNPFKFRARDVYGRPQWDLILRSFAETGFSWNHRPGPFESNRSLASAGVGAELQVRRNFNVRVDLGFPLHSIENNVVEPVRAGQPRVHFSATLAF